MGLPTEIGGTKLANGAITYSFYAANGNLLFETYPGATTFADYVYLKDRLLAHIVPAGTTYLHTDLLGSPVAGTDAAGAFAGRENYHPWGRQLLLGGATSNNLWFTGKHHDWDTKLSYFGARHYDVTLGRFMGVDPPSQSPGAHAPDQWGVYPDLQPPS